MTPEWLMFIGMKEFHLGLEDIMEMRLGEMVDMVNLLAVYAGSAKETKSMTFDEIIALR